MKASFKNTMLMTTSIFLISFMVNAEENKYFNPHQVKLGLEFENYQYKEPKGTTPIGHFHGMKMKGYMPGLNASYFYSPRHFLMGLEVRYLYGKTDYDGFLQDGNQTPYKQNKNPTNLFETRFLGGLKYKVKQFIFQPFTGIGYRYKDDDMSCSQVGGKRSSKYVYIPFGIGAVYHLNDNWKIHPSLEYDFFIAGTQISDHQKHHNFKVKNTQKRGYGLKGDIMFSFKTIGTQELSIGPYFHYWNINHSNVVIKGRIRFVEPKNDTIEMGLKISYLL